MQEIFLGEYIKSQRLELGLTQEQFKNKNSFTLQYAAKNARFGTTAQMNPFSRKSAARPSGAADCGKLLCDQHAHSCDRYQERPRPLLG